MCGRYQAWVDDDELVRIIEREKKGNALRYFRQNEVFPGSAIPVIYGSYANVRAHISTWGYRANSEDNSGRLIINARAESAADKPLFRNAAANTVPTERRILVLTSGYYEWKEEDGKKKRRCHIKPPRDGAALLLCGLESDQPDGTRRHVILTTEAHGSAAEVHHRMPLFCPREEMRLWLYDNNFALARLREKIGCELTLKYAQ